MSERKTKDQFFDSIDLEHGELSDNFAELIATLNLILLKIPEDCRSSATWSIHCNEISVYYQRPETDAEMADRLEKAERRRQQLIEHQNRRIGDDHVALRALMLKYPEVVQDFMKGKEP